MSQQIITNHTLISGTHRFNLDPINHGAQHGVGVNVHHQTIDRIHSTRKIRLLLQVVKILGFGI